MRKRQRIDPEVVPEIIDKRRAGWTLAELGKEFGVSSERIRQILSDSVSPAESRAARNEAKAEKMRKSLMEGDFSAVAPEHRPALRASLSDKDWLISEFRSRFRAVRKDQTFETYKENCSRAVEHLKQVSEQLKEPVTLSLYHEARVQDPSLFSEQWIVRLFGTWRNALEAAGLPSSWKTSRQYERLDDETLLNAVHTFIEEAAVPERRSLSANSYGAWARANGAPSRETLLKHFIWWHAVLEQVREKYYPDLYED